MFIICPKCSAKYKIPEGIKLENGQKLKCSACNFVFLKGDEEPFVLEQTEISQQQPEAPVSNLNVSPGESLPEAFQPVQSKPASKGLWIVPFYLIVIVILCLAGWIYRDSLKPSFKTTFPELYKTGTQTVKPKHRGPVRVYPKKVVPIQAKEVSIKPLDEEVSKTTTEISKTTARVSKAEPEVPKTEPAVLKTETEVVKIEPVKNLPQKMEPPEKEVPSEPIKPVKEQPKPTLLNTETKPVPSQIDREVKVLPVVTEKAPEILPPPPVQPDVVVPSPQLESKIVPVVPQPDAEAEEDEIPLFEIVEQPVPVATEKELSVNHLSFQTTTGSDGLEQVLVEGQLQNIGDEKRSVPVLNVFLVGREGQTLMKKRIHVATEHLNPGQKIPFYTSLTPAPKNIDHVDIKF